MRASTWYVRSGCAVMTTGSPASVSLRVDRSTGPQEIVEVRRMLAQADYAGITEIVQRARARMAPAGKSDGKPSAYQRERDLQRAASERAAWWSKPDTKESK
jgi:hypothetical protein